MVGTQPRGNCPNTRSAIDSLKSSQSLCASGRVDVQLSVLGELQCFVSAWKPICGHSLWCFLNFPIREANHCTYMFRFPFVLPSHLKYAFTCRRSVAQWRRIVTYVCLISNQCCSTLSFAFVWLKCLCVPGLTALLKLNALQTHVCCFHFNVFDICIMSCSSNSPLVSQQAPWPTISNIGWYDERRYDD